MKELQEEVCLQMAMQSLVTAVSGWERRPWEVQPESQRTVVPLVFSYVSTPPKHWPLTPRLTRWSAKPRTSRWTQMFGGQRWRWNGNQKLKSKPFCESAEREKLIVILCSTRSKQFFLLH